MEKDSFNFPMERFLKVEKRLKEWFGIDRNIIKPYITESAGIELLQSSDKEKYLEGNKYNVEPYLEEHINELTVFLPCNISYTIQSFCNDNELNINNESDEYIILELACNILKCNRSENQTLKDWLEYEYHEYVHAIRPDMLKLYIGLHSKKDSSDPAKKRYHKQCEISFGNLKPIKIDEKTIWFQVALERYLEKYLGVKSIEEAEQELKDVYGNKHGAKMNVDAVKYMWGTYHLLQNIPDCKSTKEKSVTNKQGKIIADLLNRLNLINYKEKECFSDYKDGERIRTLLKNYLKRYNSLDEIIRAKEYKTSPNNKDAYNFF